MGLDMYLEKHHYVRNWDHMAPKERHKITVAHEDGSPVAIKPERVSVIVELVGQWRKANAIHAWFVGANEDNCQPIPIERESLQELLGLVREVIKAPAKAPILLPSRSGCFFGSTDYDDYYFEDLKDTETMLSEILAEPEDLAELYYRASW